jgi:3-hydroxyisobutyrate dehydrogenase
MPSERIGFIGTGIMGKPMAGNLLKAGYSVTVHNRTKAKVEELLSKGATWADSPAEVTKDSDVVITCVPDTPDVKQVLLGENGVIDAARDGLICVDMSTISPAATKQMGAELAAKGVTLIDAPISGGEIGAVDGRLSIMMGGPKEAVEKVRPIMEVMGKAVTHCGPLGAGQMTKLANQVMVIHTIMSIAEGLAFAERAGLDLQTTWEVTRQVLREVTHSRRLGRRLLRGILSQPLWLICSRRI